MDKRIQLKRSKNILESRDAALAKIAELSGVTIDGEPVAFQYLDNGNVETILAIKAQKNEDRGVMVLFDSANKDLWNAIDEKLSADDLKTVNGTSLVGSGNVDANDVVYFRTTSGENHEVFWNATNRRWMPDTEIMQITDGKLYLNVDSHVLYWATDQLHEIFDLSNFYNKEDVNNLLDDKLDVSAYTPVDLTNYYVKDETDALLDNKLDVSAYTPVDLSNYYDKDETDDLLDDKVDKTTFNRFSGDTVRDLSSLHQDKLDASAYTPVDLTNYYNKDETDAFLDDKLDVSAYTQIEEVVFGTLLDDGFHTGEWVESHGNEEFIPDREVVEPSDSKIYVDVVENKVYRWRRQYYEISSSGGDMSEYVQKTTFNILSGNVDDNKAELDAAEVAVFGVDTDSSLGDASAFYSASTLLSGSTSMVEADMTLASSISAITGELDEKLSASDLKTVNGESIVGSGNIDTENVVLGKLVTGSESVSSEDFYKFLGTYSYGPMHDENPDFSDTAETPDANKTYVDILTKKAYWYDANPILAGDRFKELSVADLSNYYNKTEIDSIVSGKSDSSDVYTKTEVDAMLSGKCDDVVLIEAFDFTSSHGLSSITSDTQNAYSVISSAITDGNVVILTYKNNFYNLAYSDAREFVFECDSTNSNERGKTMFMHVSFDNTFVYTEYTSALSGDSYTKAEVDEALSGMVSSVVSNNDTIIVTESDGEVDLSLIGGEGIDIEEGVVIGGLRYITPGGVQFETKKGKYVLINGVLEHGDLNGDGVSDAQDLIFLINLVLAGGGSMSSSTYDRYASSEMTYWEETSGYSHDTYVYWNSNPDFSGETAKRVANIVGFFNEDVIDFIKSQDPTSNLDYVGTAPNYFFGPNQVTSYIRLLENYKQTKQISILEINNRHGVTENKIIDNLTLDNYEFTNSTEDNNVNFNMSKTSIGYQVRGNVEIFDCGEFDGPQVNSGG